MIHFVSADIVEIKHIMLPPSARDFKDIYVVFELMETDLHQVCLPRSCLAGRTKCYQRVGFYHGHMCSAMLPLRAFNVLGRSSRPMMT